jgi:hypothetical protein
MRIWLLGLLAVSSTCLSGCAGVVTAFKNDPLQSYDVKGPSVYAMTGDRRTAVYTRQTSDLKFCAESMPDAIAAIAASSKANLDTGKVEGGFSDATAVGILQTFQRTEIAELSRQLAWNTCLAWAQGAIDNVQYHALLTKIVDGSIEVMKTRSTQEVKTIAPLGHLLVNVGAPGATVGGTPAGGAAGAGAGAAAGGAAGAGAGAAAGGAAGAGAGAAAGGAAGGGAGTGAGGAAAAATGK